jgi:hypothetical protein
MLLQGSRTSERSQGSYCEARLSLDISSGNSSWSACFLLLHIYLRSLVYSFVLKFLGLSHPAIDTRDIASFVPFRKSLGYKNSQIIPLNILVNQFMGWDLGLGYEHPVSVSPPAISRIILSQKCSLIFCSSSARNRSCMSGPVSFSDTLGGSNSARSMAMYHHRRRTRNSPPLFHLTSLAFQLSRIHTYTLSLTLIGLI